MAKNDIVEKIADAFEKKLKEAGWKKIYPKSVSVDKAYFKKGLDTIVRGGNAGNVYAYQGMKLLIETDGGTCVQYADDTQHMQHELEIINCMKRAEKSFRVKLNG